MLGLGFFMGVFLATIDVAGSALFLQHYDEKLDLPEAIVLSGIVGLVLTGIYNFFQSRVSYTTLSIATSLLIAGLLVALQFAFNSFEDPKIIYKGIFILLLPLNYLSLLIFWGIFGRIFTLRESKKIIGSIDTGQLLASILALFSIPILTRFIKVEQLLIISTVAAIGAVVMIMLISLRGFMKISGQKANGRVSWVKIIKSKYVGIMALFVILSTIALTFVDFAFLNATGQQYSDVSLANFLSVFEATVVIFSFLFQTFVTDRVISLYGLRFSLIINPILIGGFTIIATFIGTLFGFVKEGNESFIFFFIIISMSKLFIDSLKDALDGPAFKLYYLPIDSEVRFDVQTKVDGVVTAFAGLLAGLLFIGFNKLNLSLLYVTIFTIPLLFFWYLITNKMHDGYKSTLQNTLIKNKEKQKVEVRQEFSVNQVLENAINSNRPENILYSLKLMEKLEPGLFENAAVSLLKSNNDTIRNFAVDKVKNLNLEYEKGSAIHELAVKAFEQSELPEVAEVSQKSSLEKMGKSLKAEDRIKASRLLRTGLDHQNIFLLLELLRDMNPAVRLEAIKTARKVKRPETWTVLIDMTDSVNYGHAATAALIDAGEDALHSLEMAFSKSGQRIPVMIKIITIIGRIGGNEAVKLLWNKIDYPDKRISSQILIWLRYFDYKASSERERQVLFELLDNDIGKAIWNLSALEELPDKPEYLHTKTAISDEYKANQDHIFMLLSILYDQESIQLVRENIESGTSEGIAFALELMDIFIDKDLRPKLFPLFDDVETIDKLHQLQVFFPREEYTPWEVLNFLLNRTFDQANRWTKACALHSMAFFEDFKVTKAMVAQLFNPDYMIQETAAWVIYHKQKEIFNKVAKRLPDDDRKMLVDSISRNQLIDGLDDGAFLRIEMVMFMKTIPLLSNIKGVQLSHIADRMKVIQLEEGKSYFFNQSTQDHSVIIIAEGKAELALNSHENIELSKKDVFGEVFILNSGVKSEKITSLENTTIFEIQSTDFYSILGDNHVLVQDLIDSVTKQLNLKELINE